MNEVGKIIIVYYRLHSINYVYYLLFCLFIYCPKVFHPKKKRNVLKFSERNEMNLLKLETEIVNDWRDNVVFLKNVAKAIFSVNALQ